MVAKPDLYLWQTSLLPCSFLDGIALSLSGRLRLVSYSYLNAHVESIRMSVEYQLLSKSKEAQMVWSCVDCRRICYIQKPKTEVLQDAQARCGKRMKIVHTFYKHVYTALLTPEYVVIMLTTEAHGHLS